MQKETKAGQLKWQLVGVVVTCWLIPVLLILSVIGVYVMWSQSRQTSQSYTRQLETNLEMSAGKLDSAIESSRVISYNPSIKNAWTAYVADGIYIDLYSEASRFLDWQYRNDSRFRTATLCFLDDPLEHNVSVINEYAGAEQGDLDALKSNDISDIMLFAGGLDSSIGFYSAEGRLYLIRNVKDSSYETFAVFIQSLNMPYYFDNLMALDWAASISVSLNGDEFMITGDRLPDSPAHGIDPEVGGENGGFIYHTLTGRDGYTFAALAEINSSVLIRQYFGYIYLLAAMLLVLIPIVFYVMRFFTKRIHEPVNALLGAAERIAAGDFGYNLEYSANSREFACLVESFNDMSSQLNRQFDRLYHEELALRDARIKALQNHVNPRFLSNTLEIIGWQSKLGGDPKVSKMLESLATIINAANEKDSVPEIPLSEEINYVNAYLYIISARYGKRLTINRNIDDDAMWRSVPRLILQPIVENAIEHGIDSIGRGQVEIRAFTEDGLLIIEVENDGEMKDEDVLRVERLLSQEDEQHSEEGLGIKNVHTRLRIIYGDASGLTLENTGGGTVVARLKISRSGTHGDAH